MGITLTHRRIWGYIFGEASCFEARRAERAGMGSAGGLGALRAPLAGFGGEPQPKSNLLPFSPKISHQVATISIIFNAMQTTNFKVKNISGGNASPASPLNPPMH